MLVVHHKGFTGEVTDKVLGDAPQLLRVILNSKDKRRAGLALYHLRKSCLVVMLLIIVLSFIHYRSQLHPVPLNQTIVGTLSPFPAIFPGAMPQLLVLHPVSWFVSWSQFYD